MGAPSSSEGREDPPRERQQGRTALPVPSGRLPLAEPVIFSTAMADEIEAIVASEGAAVMTDEPADELSVLLAEGVICDGFAR